MNADSLEPRASASIRGQLLVECVFDLRQYDSNPGKKGTGTKFRKSGEIRASPRFAQCHDPYFFSMAVMAVSVPSPEVPTMTLMVRFLASSVAWTMPPWSVLVVRLILKPPVFRASE